jgi:hypothetical protein
MQETHLKKVEKTSILKTLKSFELGESELIMFSDSQTDTNTWRARYGKLVRDGNLGDRRFKILSHNDPLGTIILRIR